jgi:Na+-driven multidrug efflux pump
MTPFFFPLIKIVAMNPASTAALIWWVIPIGAVLCAIGYGIWISKYKSKFDNQTNRSVDNFKKFQSTFKNKK